MNLFKDFFFLIFKKYAQFPTILARFSRIVIVRSRISIYLILKFAVYNEYLKGFLSIFLPSFRTLGISIANSDFKIQFWPFSSWIFKIQDDWRASGSFLHTVRRLAHLRQHEPAMTDGRAYITKRWEKSPTIPSIIYKLLFLIILFDKTYTDKKPLG